MSRRSVVKGFAFCLGAPMVNRGRYSLFGQSAADYSARTVDLVRSSTVIDMLGLLTLDYRKLMGWEAAPGLFGRAEYRRLRASGINVFHPAVGYTKGDIYRESLRDVEGWNVFLAARGGEFLRIEQAGDFQRVRAEGRIGILIGLQNSAHFRTVEDVDYFYRLGQRVSQLTYTGNRLGGGSSDARDEGLSGYGVEIVERMNAVGMAVDISHCGDRTTLDAMEASRKPVLITHSNCRALSPGSARCKTDEAIRRMAAKGGVMGITMVRGFVGAARQVTMEDVLRHMDHLVKAAGVEHAGIGSDVDLNGRDGRVSRAKRYDLDGVDYAKKIYDLTEGLVRRGYSNRNIELILGGNFERVLREVWAV
ncbi:MAG: membrane dipeptidase [Bryobacterales bacterium]|nr:membrane dipeptidase [Bryobacterales bacterium]